MPSIADLDQDIALEVIIPACDSEVVDSRGQIADVEAIGCRYGRSDGSSRGPSEQGAGRRWERRKIRGRGEVELGGGDDNSEDGQDGNCGKEHVQRMTILQAHKVH